MDSLDQRITEKEREVIELQQRLDKAKLELRVFKEAAALRPAPQTIPATLGEALLPTVTLQVPTAAEVIEGFVANGHGERRGGRQTGSISHQWRATLGALVQRGNHPQSPAAISTVAKSMGHDVDPREVRERLRHYAEVGLVDRIDANYKVSQAAIERFGLMK